jgi:hypothetical protein
MNGRATLSNGFAVKENGGGTMSIIFWLPHIFGGPAVFTTCFCRMGSRDNSVGIATGYGLDGQEARNLSPGRCKMFLLSMSSRQILGPRQPSIQWVLGVIYPRVKRSGHEADHYHQLMLTSRIYGSIHPLPHTLSWCS